MFERPVPIFLGFLLGLTAGLAIMPTLPKGRTELDKIQSKQAAPIQIENKCDCPDTSHLSDK